MPALLIAEHDNQRLREATGKAVTAAKAVSGEVHVLVAGQGCKAVAEAAAKINGVGKVLLAEAPALRTGGSVVFSTSSRGVVSTP